MERCSVTGKGWLQTKAGKGHPYSHFIFITTGACSPVHTQGLHAHAAQRLRAHGEIHTLNKSKYTECRQRCLNISIRLPNAASATQNKRDVNYAPPPPPLALTFFFFGVSDRLIKDYNLSSSEGQRIGLAISNLIFFQVAAKLKFVLLRKMIPPSMQPRSSKFHVRMTMFTICLVTQASSSRFSGIRGKVDFIY